MEQIGESPDLLSIFTWNFQLEGKRVSQQTEIYQKSNFENDLNTFVVQILYKINFFAKISLKYNLDMKFTVLLKLLR